MEHCCPSTGTKQSKTPSRVYPARRSYPQVIQNGCGGKIAQLD